MGVQRAAARGLDLRGGVVGGGGGGGHDGVEGGLAGVGSPREEDAVGEGSGEVGVVDEVGLEGLPHLPRGLAVEPVVTARGGGDELVGSRAEDEAQVQLGDAAGEGPGAGVFQALVQADAVVASLVGAVGGGKAVVLLPPQGGPPHEEVVGDAVEGELVEDLVVEDVPLVGLHVVAALGLGQGPAHGDGVVAQELVGEVLHEGLGEGGAHLHAPPVAGVGDVGGDALLGHLLGQVEGRGCRGRRWGRGGRRGSRGCRGPRR